MSTAIVIDARGLWTVSIEDSDGVPRDYEVRRIPPGLDNIAFEFHRLDAGDRYRVAMDGRGRVSCGCPDFRYRRGKDGVIAGCKHSRAFQSLVRLMDEFNKEP